VHVFDRAQVELALVGLASSGRRNGLRGVHESSESFGGGVPVQGSARSGVELVGDGLEGVTVVHAQIGSLDEVLTQ
jgi:hypothetical protein